MKRIAWLTLLAALALPFLSGCATNPPTRQANYDQTTKKVYTQEELSKRGRQTVGESMAAQDEQITLSQGRSR